MHPRFRVAFHVFVIMAAAWAPARAEEPADTTGESSRVSYRQDVMPILKRHCRGCHSASNRKGGLSLDSVSAMRKGGESGAMFEPGKADSSLLIELISGDEPEMPKQQPPLSAAKIEILRQWVAEGGRDDSIGSEEPTRVRIPETYQQAPAVTSIALSPDGKSVAAACRSEVVLIRAETDGEPHRIATDSDLVTHVEFSPNGQLLAAAGGAPAEYGEVRFYNASDAKLVRTVRDGTDTFFRGNFAPDNSALALGGADGGIHIVPVGEGDIRRIDIHSDWVFDVAYSADGKLLISGGRDKATKVTSVESGKLLRTLDSSAELITAVGSAAKFGVSAGRAKTLISFQYDIAVQNVEVSGAGNGSRPVSKRNQYAKNFEGLPGEVLDIATSADRKFVAVCGRFGDIRVYQLADRKRITLIKDVPSPAYCLSLNNDGSRLAVGTATGEVRLYSLPDGKPLQSLIPVPVAERATVAAK